MNSESGISSCISLSVEAGSHCGVSKRVEDGYRPHALRADHPQNNHLAVSGVAHLQGVEELGMASPGETLGLRESVDAPCHIDLTRRVDMKGEMGHWY
jgi:hypothetical protein